jgi:hypothetical protein
MRRCTRRGKRWRCKNESSGGYCDHCLEVRRRRNGTGESPTLVDLARYFRSQHGYTRVEAEVIAEMVYTAVECAICLVPNAVARALYELGGPFAATPNHNNVRFTPDRINVEQAHTLANTRIVCWPCNSIRNRNRVTDETIRERIHRWWREEGPAELAGWLEGKAMPPSAAVEEAFG